MHSIPALSRRGRITLRTGMTTSAVAAALAGLAAPAAAQTPAEAPPAEAPPAEAQAAAEAPQQLHYEVVPGDNLSSIAAEHGLPGWRPLFDANPEIGDPNVILPGQVLRIPAPGEGLEPRPQPGATPPAPAQESTAPAQTEGATVTPTPAAQPAEPPPAQGTQPEVATTAPGAGVWDRLAQCEAGGNWAANTGNGYYGGLQFSLSSWQAVGGSGYPHQASKAEQIQRGQQLQAAQGWGAWPACSRKLGLR